MPDQDYHATITARVPLTDAFDKISRVPEWWAEDFAGQTRKPGDKFMVRFGETFVDFEVGEANPNRRLVWRVTNCHLHWLKDKTEWTGTDVVWDLASQGSETTVTLTHRGITPEVECYDTCVKGWDFYVKTSLLQFLSGGKGVPETKAKRRELDAAAGRR